MASSVDLRGKTKTLNRTKPYSGMTTAELHKATAAFDQEFVAATFGPPMPKQRAQHAKARRKRGRPRVGNGAKTISVTIEKGLLAKTDCLAKKMHTTRAALIARGLQSVVESG